MKNFFLSLIFIFCLEFFLGSNGWALETVNFLSEPGPHSPFKIKRAKAKGKVLPPKEKIELTGYLGRPATETPAPAVILLHSGFGLQEFHKSWAKQLVEWGYVALLIYSYAGEKEEVPPSVNMSRDVISNAYGAYEFLKTQSYVDPARIGVMGWSSGAKRAYSLIDEALPPGREKQKVIKAAIMIYPNCSPDGGLFRAPMLILLGDSDQYLVNGDCQQFKIAAQQQNPLQVVQVHVYPGATHFFDDPKYPSEGDQAQTTTRFRYNPRAYQDSLQRARQFLDHFLF
ncbi:MAG: dienelactone hydrolase family protein [Gammaproteobacteria bacterium]|nr:dienelactone hydrolase family protein [Gammaproteobacteria bacterium]